MDDAPREVAVGVVPAGRTLVDVALIVDGERVSAAAADELRLLLGLLDESAGPSQMVPVPTALHVRNAGGGGLSTSVAGWAAWAAGTRARALIAPAMSARE